MRITLVRPQTLLLVAIVVVVVASFHVSEAVTDVNTNKRFLEAQFLNVKDAIKAGEDAHKDDTVIEVTSSNPVLARGLDKSNDASSPSPLSCNKY